MFPNNLEIYLKRNPLSPLKNPLIHPQFDSNNPPIEPNFKPQKNPESLLIHPQMWSYYTLKPSLLPQILSLKELPIHTPTSLSSFH
jgi:hypothetical protein